MKAIVEFCASNALSESEEVIKALEEDPDLDVDVVEYGCLGNCGECFAEPYALVNGDYVSATTPDKLLAEIKRKIKEDEDSLEKDFPF